MNKSKFLKKSLAMLLALMLVVAMIPLSASAATTGDIAIEYIYVDGNKVDLEDEMTVDVSEDAEEINIGTNIDLGKYNAEMVAMAIVEGVEDPQVIKQGVKPDPAVEFDPYAPDDVITLVLRPVDDVNNPIATYTLKLNRTKDNTTTNLAKVEADQDSGVYAIENDLDDINATRTVKVTAAYGATNPQIKVTGDEEATIKDGTPDGSKTANVNADDKDTFEVVSESKNNTAEYTVETTYVDALTSFSVNGVKGQITDENDDDHDDTITVVLPKEAVLDAYGDPLAAPDVNFKVEYAIYAKTGTVSFDDGSTWVNSGAEINFGELVSNNGVYTEEITTKVIGDVPQTYTLNVVLEQDDDTSISFAQIAAENEAGKWNVVKATVDGKEINAEMAYGYNLKEANITLRTPLTVDDVVVAGESAGKKEELPAYIEWTFYDIDVTSPKAVTVTAENNTITEYTLDVTVADEVREPGVESLSIEDPDTGIVYTGTPDSKRVIEIEVPYMTLDVQDWIVRVSPASGCRVLTETNSDIVNGETTGANLQLWGNIPTTDAGKTADITAVDKTNNTDKKTYTVKVVLAEPGSGKTLKTLNFTSQKAANGTTLNDETVYRALNDDNTFEAKVDNGKKTITLQPALSLSQTGYQHIVTDYTTAEGGVAFLIENVDTTYSVGTVLGATVNDEKDDSLTGSKLGEDKTVPTYSTDTEYTIAVVPEKVAREAIKNAGDSKYIKIAASDIDTYGTEYSIDIVPAKALKEADLKTFKIGDVELKVSGNTISGELPWSYTIAADADKKKASENKIADGVTIYGYYPEFTMGKYAEMSSATKVFNSLGDVNGDGKAEAPSDNNMSLVFVQGANNTVDVYRANEKNVSDNKIEYLTVKAEDRLNDGGKVTSKNYVFKLTYAEPEIEANIESFKLGGYTGTINGTSINVRVPYKTDLKGMVAEFTTSTGAKVYFENDEDTPVKSGETVLNYSSPFKLVVHSEKTKNGKVDGESVTVKTYTISVTEAEMFSDVSENKWYYDYVLDAANLGIINGRGDGIFAPEEDVTRGDFAVMLTNMLGVKNMPSVENNPFADVNENKYYSDAIAYCYKEGYIGGYPDGTFKPEQSITRQEAAKIMAEAMELTEVSDELFNDDAKIGGWASEFVYQCRAAGIFGGDADTGNFRPTDAISRAETAKIMVEAYNLK